jgi:hypothetical protein
VLTVQQIARLFRAFICLEVRNGGRKALVVAESGVRHHFAINEIFREEQNVAHSLAIAVARELAQEDGVSAFCLGANFEVVEGGEHGVAVLVDGPALAERAWHTVRVRRREDVCRHAVLGREGLWWRGRCGAAQGAVHKRAVGEVRGTRAARTRPTGHFFLCGRGIAAPCWEQRATVEAGRVAGARREVWRLPETSGSRVSTVCEDGRRRGCCLGVKQLRNVVMPRSTFSGRRSQVVIAREKAADWRVAQQK